MYHTTYQTILNPLTHHYNTRCEAVQQRKTVHAFAQHTCLFYMIDFINKSSIIKVRVTTSQTIQAFVFSVKREILNSYEFFYICILFFPIFFCLT